LSTLQTSQHSHGNQLDLRTFILGVCNGAVYMAARACIDPEMLLPAFAVQMMAGNVVWVGMISALSAAGWFWPQIIVARYLETRTHLMPTYLASVVVRCTCAALIPVAVYYWGPVRPQLAFVSASLLLFALASAGGFGLVPFMSVVHDAIPARWLGTVEVFCASPLPRSPRFSWPRAGQTTSDAFCSNTFWDLTSPKGNVVDSRTPRSASRPR